MNRDMVLVALSREAAHLIDCPGWLENVENSVSDEFDAALRAALDTDREDTIARISERLMWEDGIDDTGQIYGPEADLTSADHDLRGEYESKAEAVLALLEGGSDE